MSFPKNFPFLSVQCFIRGPGVPLPPIVGFLDDQPSRQPCTYVVDRCFPSLAIIEPKAFRRPIHLPQPKKDLPPFSFSFTSLTQDDLESRANQPYVPHECYHLPVCESSLWPRKNPCSANWFLESSNCWFGEKWALLGNPSLSLESGNPFIRLCGNPDLEKSPLPHPSAVWPSRLWGLFPATKKAWSMQLMVEDVIGKKMTSPMGSVSVGQSTDSSIPSGTPSRSSFSGSIRGRSPLHPQGRAQKRIERIHSSIDGITCFTTCGKAHLKWWIT